MTRRKLPSRGSKRGYRRTGSARGRSKKALVSHSPLFKSGLRFLVIVLLFVALFVSYRVYAHRIWKRSDRITFVFQELESSSAPGIHVVSYLSSAETLALVSFPAGMKIEAVGEFGLWRVESLYPLGEMESKGGELLKQSLAEFFGASIDGWLVTGSGGVEIKRETARSGFRQIIGKAIFGRANTNLGLWDLIGLWRAIGLVRLHNVEWLNFSQVGAVSEQIQPDGSTAFIADLELLDQLSRHLFSHPELVEEGLAIAVLNATNHRGLGARVARNIRNMGGDVVSVSDSLRNQDSSKLWVSQDELLGSFTARFLAKTFLIDKVSKGETSQQRADVLIIVGENYWTRLTEL